MDVTTYSNLRANLSSMMDKVNNDHAPLLITRQNGEPAVLMSLEDYSAHAETAYLLASPANKKMLLESIKEADEGKLIPMTMERLEAMERDES